MLEGYLAAFFESNFGLSEKVFSVLANFSPSILKLKPNSASTARLRESKVESNTFVFYCRPVRVIVYIHVLFRF